MNETILAKEFLENTFNLDFLTTSEYETLRTAMELYAKGKCKEQREICYDEWLNMPEWEDDTPKEKRERGERTLLHAPEPKLGL